MQHMLHTDSNGKHVQMMPYNGNQEVNNLMIDWKCGNILLLIESVDNLLSGKA
jgi:hypothetical protein